MSVFILTISLTTSNFPWFMDLMFQVPIQCCSLQRQILLSSPDTSTTECHIQFGPGASCILGLLVILLRSFPVASWTPSDLEDSSFGAISFWPFMQFMRFSQQVSWGGLPSLLQWTTFSQNSLLWPVCLGWPYIAWLIASLTYSNPFTRTKL